MWLDTQYQSFSAIYDFIGLYSSYSFQCYCFWMNISQEIWFTNTFTHRLEKINICSRPIFGNPQNSEDVFPQSESSRSRNSTLNDEVHGVFSFMQYEGTVFTQWHFLLGFLVTKLALNIVSKEKNNTQCQQVHRKFVDFDCFIVVWMGLCVLWLLRLRCIQAERTSQVTVFLLPGG